MPDIIYNNVEVILDEKERRLYKSLKNLKAEALLKIEELENEDYKNILVMRYLKYMNSDDISKVLYISVSIVKRWKDNGLDSIIV